MNQTIKWVLLGLVAYLIFLIAKLPASLVVGMVNLPQNIAVGGVQGSIWNGSATTVVANNIAVENVKWEISFLRLFTGRIALDLKAGNARIGGKVSFTGPVSISLFDQTDIQASDFTLYLPANMVIAQVPLPVPVNANGRFKVQIEELDYPGQCAELIGKGQWLNAGLDGLAQPLMLGNFDADLSCVENDTLVAIKEPNSFGLTANAIITSSFGISVKGQFKPSEQIPTQVKNVIRDFYPPANAQGYYSINL